MLKMSDDIGQISEAMAAFQGTPTIIGKDKKGYGYEYVSLDKAIERVLPRISSLGLSIMQPLGEVGGGPAVWTIVLHKSGQYIATAYPLSEAGMKGVNNAQQFGAAVTYARRYGLLAAFGIGTGDDDDAACLTEKPEAKKPEGKKYPEDQGTMVDDIIAEMMNQTDLESLMDYMGSVKATVKSLPKFAQDKITTEFHVHRGTLEMGGK